MQEEIKEILNNFEKYDARYRLCNETQFIITHREIQILLDYITNSQEENEYSNHCNEELRKKITNLEYKIERLEEDNKQLKDLCDKYEEEHNTTFIEWQKDIKANKKAIEYIEWHYKDNQEFYKNKGIGLNYPECDGLLNILKGDNK